MKKLPKKVDEAEVSADGDIIYYTTQDSNEAHKTANLPLWAKKAILSAVDNAKKSGYHTAKQEVRVALGIK